jgi:hypothetical protein
MPSRQGSTYRNFEVKSHAGRHVGAMVFLILGAVLIASRSQKDEVVASSVLPNSAASPKLVLNILDNKTGKPATARFSLHIDGTPFYPETLNKHGLRFVSVHESKKQTYVVTYSRGIGPVEVELPPDAKQIEIHAARGFEYFPVSTQRTISGKKVIVNLKLRRWTDQLSQGWAAAEEHLHYDRLTQAGDKDWLTMLDGDGLTHAHFMVLKGGKVSGIWAQQYAYGKQGEASDGERMIRSGEEYRDSAQGHINLLGINEIIQPISTGGLGKPPVRVNYPPLHDVFQRTRKLSGLGGVAHGGSLGRFPTAILDTVLGAVDFFEIANAHLYSRELWYRLMNCGYILPPAAGTDLPNYPFRDDWQPFLGSMRMYVKVGNRRDFESWKAAVRRGEVYVTSGPVLSFRVNGEGPGKTVKLPAVGGTVRIECEMATPIGLKSLEVVQNGKVVPATIEKQLIDGLHRWKVSHTLKVNESCWLAMRGRGVPIQALDKSLTSIKAPWLESDVIAHSAAIQVKVGGLPTRSAKDAEFLIGQLRRQQEYYRTQGRYQDGKHRLQMLNLFEQAIEKLSKQL